MGLPFAAAFGVWSLASLIIVGSPFETFTSVYGGSNQIALSIESIRRTTGETSAAALGYAARQMIGLHPLLLPIVGAAGAAAILRRDTRVLAVGAIFGSIILFSLVLFLAGKSFGWLRFYIGIIPLGAMAAAYIISLANEPIRARHRFDIGPAVMERFRMVTAGVRRSADRLPSAARTGQASLSGSRRSSMPCRRTWPPRGSRARLPPRRSSLDGAMRPAGRAAHSPRPWRHQRPGGFLRASPPRAAGPLPQPCLP